MLGDLTMLPKDVQDAMEECENRTKDYKNGTLNVCLCYNSEHEIMEAMESLAAKHACGEVDSITKENFEKELYGGKDLKPEILIRTSAEVRLSNYLLY